MLEILSTDIRAGTMAALATMLLGLLITGASAAPMRVLFVGNSFTFVNDLPHQMVNIAKSLGQEVEVANSTIGGCTAYFQRAESDPRTAELLEQDWDYIVLQSYSNLPTVSGSRKTYLEPAVASFVAKKKQAKVVMYLTWGYRSGNIEPCPSSGPSKCFPLGTNANLTRPPCEQSGDWHAKVSTFECMGYAVARGYMDQLHAGGADIVAPCGLAWQVARGAAPPDGVCRASIDNEYTGSSPFTAANNLSLPLKVAGLPPSLSSFELYRKLGGGKWDKHPNQAGQYLNALVFFTTLSGMSPVGAGEKYIRGLGGSLEPPGPLPTHLHTV
jgi:hypothetical protein